MACAESATENIPLRCVAARMFVRDQMMPGFIRMIAPRTRPCILNKCTKAWRLDDTLAVCPRSIGQTFPAACHHCPGAYSNGTPIRWHIWASAPEKYDAKPQ